MTKASMIERTARLSAKRVSKRCGNKLKAHEDFQQDVPRLHVSDDIKVITINGISRGMVRRLGVDMFLWSSACGEGREDTEAAAFLRLGFLYLLNSNGEYHIKKIGSDL